MKQPSAMERQSVVGVLDRPWALRAYRGLALATLYTLMSALVLDLWWGEFGHENVITYADHFGVRGMLSYSASRPFVFRVLTPFVVNTVTAALHGIGIHALPARIEASLEDRFSWWSSGPALELYVLYVMHFACLIGLCYVWRALLSHFTAARESAGFSVALAPCVGLIVYPLTFAGNGMIYDLVDLLLVSLCLLLWLQRRFIAYYAVFALAVACKEASLVLAVMSLASFVRVREWSRAVRHTAIHVAVFSLVHLPIRMHFTATRWEQYLPLDHLKFLVHPGAYAAVRLSYASGVPLPAGLNILVMTLFAVSIGLQWRRKSPELRTIFLATFAVLLPMFLVGGFIDEIRVFAILFPSAFVLGMQAFIWTFDGVRETGEVSDEAVLDGAQSERRAA
jgi:hypothetical protein